MSTAEKFELLDLLWEDIEAHRHALPLDDVKEFDRRLSAYEKDGSLGMPWEKVKGRSPGR